MPLIELEGLINAKNAAAQRGFRSQSENNDLDLASKIFQKAEDFVSNPITRIVAGLVAQGVDAYAVKDLIVATISQMEFANPTYPLILTVQESNGNIAVVEPNQTLLKALVAGLDDFLPATPSSSFLPTENLFQYTSIPGGEPNKPLANALLCALVVHGYPMTEDVLGKLMQAGTRLRNAEAAGRTGLPIQSNTPIRRL